MARMRRKFADRSDIRDRKNYGQSGSGFIASRRAAKTAENRRRRGEVGQFQRDVNTGLRSLLPNREISGLTGVSWPGGMERYQHANHPLNEASAWPALGSQRMDNSFMGKWDMTGGPNLYSGNYPMYPTWTGGEGLTGSQGYGREGYSPLQYKWGYNTDFLETGKTAAEQSEKYPLGEFSGTEFPPRPLDYDKNEFADPLVERYQPAEGTEYTPMEHIDYDALHTMNPADAGEFGNDHATEMLGLPPKQRVGKIANILKNLFGYNRGGIASLIRR